VQPAPILEADINRKVTHGVTDPHRLIKQINDRIRDKPEDVIWIGQMLTKIFGAKLPKKHWADWGIKLTYPEAAQIKAMAICDLMTDNLDHFPSSRSTMIDLYQLAKKKPAVFRHSIRNGNISPLVLRRTIRDLRKYGKPLETLRTDERKAALANADLNSGDNIHTGHMRLLYDLVDDNSVDLILTDPPWQEPALYGELAKLAASKLKSGALCLAYVSKYHTLEILDQMRPHLDYFWEFGVYFPSRQLARYDRNVSPCFQPVWAFQKPPFKKIPKTNAGRRHGRARQTPPCLGAELKGNAPTGSTIDDAGGVDRRSILRRGNDSSRLQAIGPDLYCHGNRPGNSGQSSAAITANLLSR
jgi:hypothetical protein